MKTRFTYFAAFLLAALAAIAVGVESPAETGSASATYSHGNLQVAIPYQELHAGAGQLTVEVLNPDGEVLARAERRGRCGRFGRLARGVEAGEADGGGRPGVAAGAVPVCLQRRKECGGGGYGIDFDDAAHAGHSYFGAAVVSFGGKCGGAGDRHGLEERADCGTGHVDD